jgi:hypothetical protein
MDAASKVFLQKSEDKQEDSGRSTQSVPKIRVNSRSLWSFDAQKIIKKSMENLGKGWKTRWKPVGFPSFSQLLDPRPPAPQLLHAPAGQAPVVAEFETWSR